jgi:hypothetical protein
VISSIWWKPSIAAGCEGGFGGKASGGDRSALVPVKSSECPGLAEALEVLRGGKVLGGSGAVKSLL